MNRIIPFCLFLIAGITLNAQYSISGRVNLGEDWQSKIFMASINKLSDYYRTSPDMIVNTAPIDSNGYFVLSGDNLPDEKQFYRLYLMKNQNTDYDACLYVGGDDHNFAHIILSNGESLEIKAEDTSIAPFGEYQIVGQKENEMMRSLAQVVFPSFYFYRIKFPTELKFSEDKLHTNLKNFVDTCQSTLVSLAAINNTDFDEYYDVDKNFYLEFANRLQTNLPTSIYTKNYLLKLRYHANEDLSFKQETPIWNYFLIIGLLLACLFLAIQNLMIKKKVRNVEIPDQNNSKLIHELTSKEKEILELIHQGKSNKEIASELFIELSTVKTHINKLYSKLGITNRKEAIKMAENFLQ